MNLDHIPYYIIINNIEPYTRNTMPINILRDLRNYVGSSENIYSLYLNILIQNRKNDLLNGYYVDSIYSLYRFIVNDIIQFINLGLSENCSNFFNYKSAIYNQIDKYDYDQKKYKFIFNSLWTRLPPEVREEFYNFIYIKMKNIVI